MADPDPRVDASSSRRHRRADRVRRRWRGVATGVTIGLLVIGFGLVITDVVRFGGGERPSLARTIESPASTPTDATTSTTSPPGLACRAPLTDAAPLRLWIGGDSLAGSLGPALGALSGATGVVQPQFDSRVSSGLTTPTFFDWPDHATKEMARLDPEVAVFIIGANDFGAPLNTREDDHGTAVWKTDYTARIETMLTALGELNRRVIWLSSPPFKDDRNDQIQDVDALTKDVIAKHKNVVYVDTYKLFSDDQGKYQAALPPLDDPNGTPVTVRTGDGVHFTQAGADRIGTAVFKVIDAQCKATKQAVPGVVKVTLQTEGSTQVAGGSSRGGTVQTTPPATSPPTTTTTTSSAPTTTTTVAPTTTTGQPSDTSSTTTSTTTTTTTTTRVP
ncbi:MAG: DUF459 domain-containing protein [Acidimicrobiia bacterium]